MVQITLLKILYAAIPGKTTTGAQAQRTISLLAELTGAPAALLSGSGPHLSHPLFLFLSLSLSLSLSPSFCLFCFGSGGIAAAAGADERS